MKSLRRSFNNKQDIHAPQISTPIPALSKPPSAIQPPKKVIRALNDHRAQAPNQLSFQKGDFFHVVNDDDGGDWYEANNPITGARGLVPKAKFEAFNKGNAASRVSQAAGLRSPISPPPKSPPMSPRHPVFYAIVQHNFEAERPDELDAKAGDPITVVAQSNYEWFVAKPISRLGRPGLIPVSFVALHDPSTGHILHDDEVQSLMRRGEVPTVEEWKRAILEYKATSISLGVIDDSTTGGPVQNSPYMRSPSELGSKLSEQVQTLPPTQEEEVPGPSNPPCLPSGILLSAEVVSWHYEMEEYWFRINALFQPDDPSGSNALPPARQLVLFRVYNDFYDFQVELLNTFPVEAGRATPEGQPVSDSQESRILPYMPGPAAKVDDEVTIIRREELDRYLVQLSDLWELNADHVLRNQLIREFFAPKAGDVEDEVPAALNIFEQRYGPDHGFVEAAPQNPEQARHQGEQVVSEERIRHPFNQMSLRAETDADGHSEGSQYDDGTDLPPIRSDSRQNQHPATRSLANANGHQRTGSSSSLGLRGEVDRGPSPYSRSHSPHVPRGHTPIQGQDRVGSPTPKLPPLAPSLSRINTEQANSRTTSGNNSPTSYMSTPITNGPAAMRTRSASNANNPPISATNPNTAFVKIKIFDKLTQELIAIRVNPKVTHSQLMEKVRSRLGEDVHHLTYRNSMHNDYSDLMDDKALKQWLEATDKHVLFAE